MGVVLLGCRAPLPASFSEVQIDPAFDVVPMLHLLSGLAIPAHLQGASCPHPLIMRGYCDGVDEGLDPMAELFCDALANRPCILELSWEEAAEVDGFADAEDDVPLGQLARPMGLVDLPLQFEDHALPAFRGVGPWG